MLIAERLLEAIELMDWVKTVLLRLKSLARLLMPTRYEGEVQNPHSHLKLPSQQCPDGQDHEDNQHIS
jgi:hypothetical protein